MNWRAGIILAAVVALSASQAVAQDLRLTIPSVWIDGNPTARSFGMGFTSIATDDRVPSLRNPGSIGTWAMSGTAYSMHNWERGGPGGGVSYDLENSVYGVSASYLPTNMDRPPRLSMGFLYSSGRYRVGPSAEIDIFDDRYLVTRTRSIDTYGAGLGLNVGIDFGLGFTVDDVDTRYEYDKSDDDFIVREYPSTDRIATMGYLVRMRTLHTLHEWGFIDRMPTFGDIEFDITAAYGSSTKHHRDKDGYSFGFVSTYRDLQLLTVEYARDRDGSQRGEGWEVDLLGVVAMRLGNGRTRPPYGTFFDSDRNTVITPDWSTQGYAVDIGNAQRWARHLLGFKTSDALTWILNRLDARYETASFQNPDIAPPGLGQVSVREWRLGLTGVTRF